MTETTLTDSLTVQNVVESTAIVTAETGVIIVPRSVVLAHIPSICSGSDSFSAV